MVTVPVTPDGATVIVPLTINAGEPVAAKVSLPFVALVASPTTILAQTALDRSTVKVAPLLMMILSDDPGIPDIPEPVVIVLQDTEVETVMVVADTLLGNSKNRARDKIIIADVLKKRLSFFMLIIVYIP
jgi:hypothetical protein